MRATRALDSLSIVHPFASPILTFMHSVAEPYAHGCIQDEARSKQLQSPAQNASNMPYISIRSKSSKTRPHKLAHQYGTRQFKSLSTENLARTHRPSHEQTHTHAIRKRFVRFEYSRMCRDAVREKDRKKRRHRDRDTVQHTNKQTNKQTNKRTNRDTHTHTHTHTHTLQQTAVRPENIHEYRTRTPATSKQANKQTSK